MTAEAALRQTDRKHYDAAIAKIEDAIKTAKAEGRRFVEVDLTIEENTGWRGEIREHWRNLGYELGTHVDELFSNSSIKAGRLTLQW